VLQREERAQVPASAGPQPVTAAKPEGQSVDRAQALVFLDALAARALPLALPQAHWQKDDTPGGASGSMPGASLMAGTGQNAAQPALGAAAAPGDALEATALAADVRRFTITGPCAPLRLGLALLDGLREAAAARALPFKPGQAAVRWTPEGTLEIVLRGSVCHVFVFPGREGELADLAQPLPPAALALVLDDMGQKLEAADDVASLPFPVTMAIWPRSPHARETAMTAAARRLDCLLHQPMEALPRADKRRPDPGPGALFTHMGEAELRETLAANLRSLPTVIGLNNHMGSAFTGNAALCATLCGLLRGSGLAVLDSVTRPEPQLAAAAREAGLVALERDVFLDTRRDVAAVLKALDAAAARARAHGVAVAIVHPYPETLRALSDWQDKEGTAVVPLRRIIWKLAQDAAAAAHSHSPNITMDKE